MEFHMDIGNVLSRAWQITWRYKILWVFGILASCGSAGGGGSNGGSNGGSGHSSALINFEPITLHNSTNAFLKAFSAWLEETSPVVIFMLIALVFFAVLLIIALVLALSTIGRIGLIQGTVEAEAGAERLGFRALIKEGLPYFWRILALGLLITIGAVLVGLFVLTPVGIFTCGVGFLLFIPFAWFVAVWIEQASVAVVIENLGIMDGLRKGWQVIVDNLGIMIIMSLILYLLLGILVAVILVVPIIFLLMPAILAIVVASITETTAIVSVGVIAVIGIMVIYIPVAILISGVLRTYVGSAWTLTYMKLGKVTPELLEAPA